MWRPFRPCMARRVQYRYQRGAGGTGTRPTGRRARLRRLPRQLLSKIHVFVVVTILLLCRMHTRECQSCSRQTPRSARVAAGKLASAVLPHCTLTIYCKLTSARVAAGKLQRSARVATGKLLSAVPYSYIICFFAIELLQVVPSSLLPRLRLCPCPHCLSRSRIPAAWGPIATLHRGSPSA